jgi:hypothetical protein
MSYNGSGTFNINTTGQPVVAGTVISSSSFNSLTNDLATGLTTAITKDGQTTTTARITFAQGLTSSLVTDSSSVSTGSIITGGGVGIAKNLYVGVNANVAGTLGVTGVATFSAAPIYSSLTASSAVATDASKGLVSVTNTGTGNNVLATSPTLVTPILGTPQSGTLTNCTGLPTTALTGTITEANGGTGTTTGYYGFKNRLINSAMVIDQRNAGASVTITTAEEFITDRWQFAPSASSKLTGQQSSTAPTGFNNSILLTSSAATSVAAGDYYFLGQKIEGFNFADCGWGTASASTITLSFWCRSSITGTYGGALVNSAQNRSYPFSYSISAANTWEQKTITVAGDTTGTWIGATNGTGVRLRLGFGVGSTYSGTAGAWAAGNYMSVTGATNWISTSGATFYITGVQLEKGSTATSFDYRPYGTELQLCQRYYAKMTAGTGIYTGFGLGYQETTSVAYILFKYPTTMRSVPTFSQSNCAINDTVTFTSAATLSTTYAGLDTARIRVTFSPVGGAVSRPVDFVANNNTAAFFDMSSEL